MLDRVKLARAFSETFQYLWRDDHYASSWKSGLLAMIVGTLASELLSSAHRVFLGRAVVEVEEQQRTTRQLVLAGAMALHISRSSDT